MTNPDYLFAALELDQARYELQAKERISALLHKYETSDDDDHTPITTIEARMSPTDRVAYDQEWDKLGNIMVFTTEDQR